MTGECSPCRACLTNERGSVLVLVGAVFLMLVSFAALAVDLSYLYVVRNELQNAADAGALAGASCLAEDETETSKAKMSARRIVNLNKTGHESVSVYSIEILSGNRVRVMTRRSDTPVIFGNIFGFNRLRVTAQAIATYVDPDPWIPGDEYPVLVE